MKDRLYKEFPIAFFDTKCRKKVRMNTQNPGKINMYVCGPTVYDYIHIGNARVVIFFNFLANLFEFLGYSVHAVSNYTDIDDRMIQRSRQSSLSVLDLGTKFINAFEKDIKCLRINDTFKRVRATDYIPEIINFVKKLCDSGFAYEKNGSVYFSVKKDNNYGSLSHIVEDNLQDGVRITIRDEKDSLKDFALWKANTGEDESWSSPWGQGRPGWHIECSTMISKEFGDNVTLDIHGGGEDLIFPHHEDEAAQFRARNGQEISEYWIHTKFLLMNGEKMSKSKGNFLTLRDALKNFDSSTIKAFFLREYFQKSINFSEQVLNEIAITNKKAGDTLFKAYQILERQSDMTKQEFVKQFPEFLRELTDGIRTPNAFDILYAQIRRVNKGIANEKEDRISLNNEVGGLEFMLRILTLDELIPNFNFTLDKDIKRLIIERNRFRSTQQYDKADRIRRFLQRIGIGIEDSSYKRSYWYYL
ncbi:cysteine--tRNA ligase [Rummeliibacillus suwonensis]|uniref:cysteine--tRNA ligase n=1 Tax=Rummeliibacillus suwonensis TaxID=1306154 RepID=UPI001AAEDF4E|nr:cysteine--tRNA ligase [Rummeliibacillus suwonensis]MBO2535623.1 cysteine--tRNA ligase [Rummeliibacillus suwonensis]